MPTLAEKFSTLQSEITAAEKRYGREPGSVLLLAASKSQPLEKIRAASLAGVRDFGENYLQEALAKIEACKDLNLTWHFIGPIQSNKTRKIAEHFAWVHSLENEKIAKRLNDQRPSHLPPLNVCIEVNVSGEASKSGVAPNEVESLARYCLSLPHLHLRGLMTIPAPTDSFNTQRQAFHLLSELKQTVITKGLSFDTLSMGMSHDFEAAIAEGATIIRIGTALFGERE